MFAGISYARHVAVHKSAHDAVDGSSTGTRVPRMWALLGSHDSEERAMQTITTVGLAVC